MSRDFYITVVLVSLVVALACTICFTFYLEAQNKPIQIQNCQVVSRNVDEFNSCVN